MFLSYIAI